MVIAIPSLVEQVKGWHARPGKETVDEQAVGAASSITLRNGACLVQKPSNLPTLTTTTVDHFIAVSILTGQYVLVGVDLDSLVTAVLDSLDDEAPALAVKEVLQQAMRDQGELADALGSTFDRRTNNVLHRSDRATITHFLLPPRYRTGPHEHRMWVVTAMCSGIETNTFYRRSGEVLELIGERRIGPGELLVLGADGIHDVEAGTEPVSSIHVYGGDLGSTVRSAWEPTSLSECRYDVASEVARLTAALAAADLLARM